MQNTILKKLGQIFALVFILSLFCTHNPLENDKIEIKEKQISGKVELSDRTKPDHVFIWLEGFDIATESDNNGKFELSLPNAVYFGGRTSGSFKLFFYVANYDLDSADIVMQNGELELSHGDINDRGELKSTRYLTKKLNIQMNITPNSVPENFSGNISIELILQATEDTVIVQYPDNAAGPLSVFYFNNSDPENNFVKMNANNSPALNTASVYDTITVVHKYWMSGFEFTPNFLAVGFYEIIPYFFIEQNCIPEKLLKNIGVDLEKPTNNFVKIPAKRDGGNFTVTKGDVF